MDIRKVDIKLEESHSEFGQFFLDLFILGLQLNYPLLVLALESLLSLIVLLQHFDRLRPGVLLLPYSVSQLALELSDSVLSLVAHLSITAIVVFLQPFQLVLKALLFVAQNVGFGSLLCEFFHVLGR